MKARESVRLDRVALPKVGGRIAGLALRFHADQIGKTSCFW